MISVVVLLAVVFACAGVCEGGMTKAALMSRIADKVQAQAEQYRSESHGKKPYPPNPDLPVSVNGPHHPQGPHSQAHPRPKPYPNATEATDKSPAKVDDDYTTCTYTEWQDFQDCMRIFYNDVYVESNICSCLDWFYVQCEWSAFCCPWYTEIVPCPPQ